MTGFHLCKNPICQRWLDSTAIMIFTRIFASVSDVLANCQCQLLTKSKSFDLNNWKTWYNITCLSAFILFQSVNHRFLPEMLTSDLIISGRLMTSWRKLAGKILLNSNLSVTCNWKFLSKNLNSSFFFQILWTFSCTFVTSVESFFLFHFNNTYY